jgi:hypothetical protein
MDKLTLEQFASKPQIGEEHVTMESECYGLHPAIVVITNSTDEMYYETFVDSHTGKQYASRDHARAERI